MAGPYISDLDPAQPVDADPAGDGNEELQALKASLKNTWPNVDGGTGDTGVTTSTDQANKMNDYDTAKSSVEVRLTALEGASGGTGIVPVGTIIMWSNVPGLPIPAGWAVCNGQVANSIQTPNLQSRFIIGADGNDYDVDDTSAVNFPGRISYYVSNTEIAGNHSHFDQTENHTLSVAQMPQHQHVVQNVGIAFANNTQTGGTAQSFGGLNANTTAVGGSQGHRHTILASGEHNHVYSFEPFYYALTYLMYVGTP